ncbi:CHRD domain-containing protein [Fictibacillus macauensis ZFHKF-1]|uniref:CHRD domain-containing protein n=2 Tax=Fictibacillus TaxID=1329200 RepID=I8AE90_9BACL|nr:CHRD domain-containing protein [Fictibacillus macauensis ZFHKF-1]
MLKQFFSRLKGEHAVPAVATRASGSTEFVLSSNGNKLHFRLQVKNMKKFTQARIHLGDHWKNGPAVAYLFGNTKPGISVTSGIITGQLMAADLIGPLQGASISELLEEIKAGRAYVIVYSEFCSSGELRGPIHPQS